MSRLLRKSRIHQGFRCALVLAGVALLANSASAQQYAGVPNPFGKPRGAAETKRPVKIDVTPAKKIETSVESRPSLKATIHHSESLPPLPAKYQAGAFYGAYGLPSPTGARDPKINVQFKIPEWLAGKWERTNSIETQRTELPSGKTLKTAGLNTAKGLDVFGTYRDKTGQIWQVFSSDHATGEIDRGTATDKHTVTKYNLEVINAKTAVVEVTAYHLVISKKMQRIVDSYQDEEFNTYTLLADGKVKTDSSVKVFDGNGSPKLLTRSHSEETRIATFDELEEH